MESTLAVPRWVDPQVVEYLDEGMLESVRGMTNESGVPYQSLLNRLLRDVVGKAAENDSRLEKLEREVQALKKQVSA